MKPMSPATPQRLLVATDFSPAAILAGQRAAQIARQTQGTLRLQHVMSNSLMSDLRAWLAPGQAWQERVHQQAAAALKGEASQLKDAIGSAAIETSLSDGAPVQTITQAAHDWPADLLVVGAKGDNPLHHLLIGTTAERLLSKADRPLLVVRSEPEGDYQRVLLPLDFSPWSESAIPLARAVAPGAHLVLMHSFSIPFEEKLRFAGVDDDTLSHYRERARQDASDHLNALVDRHSLLPQDFTLSLTEGDAPAHILRVANERACDLILIGKHGRQVAEELLLGSVTRHVLAEAPCDVLVSTYRT
jgi:nucleotide-binding universal stress UspA family protein